MRFVLSGIVVAVGLVNIALFFVWLSLIKVDAANVEISEYVYNHLTTQFTMLEMFLVLAGFMTAVLALFGYQAIKGGAEAKAIETAREYLEENGKEIIQEEVRKQQVFMLRPRETITVDQVQNATSSTEVEEESGV